ncbi:MAG: DJ-1/PfpI family protein [Lachnospiraceae bacterium]|nr:DJ-1/PfpI family protein [Lachnospiraceae bacterium]
MSKIAVFFAEGYEEIEALTVVDLCRRAGLETLMVGVTDDKCVTGSHKIPVLMDMGILDVDFASLDMIVLPGGMPGTKNLEACEVLMEQVDTFYAQGKGVAAICAAPSVLGHRGILKGKKVCCYPGFEEHLDGAEVTMNSVEVVDNVITSRGMGCAINFGLAIVEKYEGVEAAKKLANGIIYA